MQVHVGGKVCQRQVMPTRICPSQCELPVMMGLRTKQEIERVVVQWPGGSRRDVPDVKLHQLTVVEQ